MIRVAVTGGLASGKSAVCELLRLRGAFTISADEVNHRLLSSDESIKKQVTELLGIDILTQNRIDRSKIASKVFADSHLLRQLEKILHPAIFDEIDKSYKDQTKNKDCWLFVAEVPLLFETRAEAFFDLVVVVDTDTKIAASRYEKKMNTGDFFNRMSNQDSQMEKTNRADFVIHNNGSFADLEKQVDSLIKYIRTRIGALQ